MKKIDKKEIKGKVKQIWSKHKNVIMFGTTLALGYGLSHWQWSRYCKKNNVCTVRPDILEVLEHAQMEYGDFSNATVGVNIVDEILRPEDLGKLGESMMEAAKEGQVLPEKLNFTHFITMGPSDIK